ncbi:flagellar assembly protein FliW [Radiobacillus deserti]|uniref:Flagellar assembly factor FliW n=1 Tax=Radiobacillus deserti TaxID=2594883 RepID=A0A516KIQ4_9BACI|nr:flagellar assembly protein FliW [Radiobacillus deserti]QDP41280.1 flagellar assembly protein FliW [Radiobacillus deserti]
MNIETYYFGELDVKDERVLSFEAGLPGFLDERQFVLLDLPDNPTFHVLQSVQTPEVAFIVTNPHLFYKDYEFVIEDKVVDILQIENEEQVSILSIVTLREPFSQSTINLQAPIVINTKQQVAKQVILNNEGFTTKHPLLTESRV